MSYTPRTTTYMIVHAFPQTSCTMVDTRTPLTQLQTLPMSSCLLLCIGSVQKRALPHTLSSSHSATACPYFHRHSWWISCCVSISCTALLPHRKSGSTPDTFTALLLWTPWSVFILHHGSSAFSVLLHDSFCIRCFCSRPRMTSRRSRIKRLAIRGSGHALCDWP